MEYSRRQQNVNMPKDYAGTEKFHHEHDQSGHETPTGSQNQGAIDNDTHLDISLNHKGGNGVAENQTTWQETKTHLVFFLIKWEKK